MAQNRHSKIGGAIKSLRWAGSGRAFITLGGDERKEFLAEVEPLTTSWAALKSTRATDVK